MLNEKTGKLQILKNDCIILEDVVCKACYVKTQKFCSRSIYPFWREIWLERAAEKAGSQGKPPGEGAVSSRRSTIAEDSPTSRPAVAIGHTKRISVASGCRDMTANG